MSRHDGGALTASRDRYRPCGLCRLGMGRHSTPTNHTTTTPPYELGRQAARGIRCTVDQPVMSVNRMYPSHTSARTVASDHMATCAFHVKHRTCPELRRARAATATWIGVGVRLGVGQPGFRRVADRLAVNSTLNRRCEADTRRPPAIGRMPNGGRRPVPIVSATRTAVRRVRLRGVAGTDTTSTALPETLACGAHRRHELPGPTIRRPRAAVIRAPRRAAECLEHDDGAE